MYRGWAQGHVQRVGKRGGYRKVYRNPGCVQRVSTGVHVQGMYRDVYRGMYRGCVQRVCTGAYI